MQEEQQYRPLHADRHGSSFNFTLVLSVGIAIFGLLQGEFVLFFIGGAIGVFTWLTTPGQYMIFADRLVIAYGRPRMRQVFFQEIGEIQALKFAFGPRLLVRLRRGGRVILQPKDAEEFESRFKGALESYIREHGGPEEESEQRPDEQPEQEPSDQDNWPSRE